MTTQARNIHAHNIIALFNELFSTEFNTVLEGAGDEPYYLPATGSNPARIRFREDFVRSALHEVAHWCVAGTARRQLPDYGYWYTPDDRDLTQQQAFFGVEVKPQAIEWRFCEALRIPFKPSVDNLGLNIPERDLAEFHQRLEQRYAGYQKNGLPTRAARFAQGLASISQSNAA